MKVLPALLALPLFLTACEQKPAPEPATPVPAPAAKPSPAKATDAKSWMWDDKRSTNPLASPVQKSGGGHR